MLTSKVNWVIFKNINKTKFIVDIVKWKKNSNEKWLKTFQRLICRPFSSKVQLEKKTFGIVIIKSIELYDIPYSKSKMKSPEIYKLTRRNSVIWNKIRFDCFSNFSNCCCLVMANILYRFINIYMNISNIRCLLLNEYKSFCIKFIWRLLEN